LIGIFFPQKEGTQSFDLFGPFYGIREVLKEWPKIEGKRSFFCHGKERDETEK
jgi:hypothetical protein